MAYENFTVYDEIDQGDNVTVITNKVSWSTLNGDQETHVAISKGAAYFNNDFEHRFEVQFSNIVLWPEINHWAISNLKETIQTLKNSAEDFVCFGQYGIWTYLRVYENGNVSSQDFWFTPSTSTTYFVTLSYDRDGGANSTGQYTAVIRINSHTGTIQDTLTVDSPVGGQHDYEFIFALQNSGEGDANEYADGFTQNLDLQEIPAGAAGAMTENTGFWGQIVGE